MLDKQMVEVMNNDYKIVFVVFLLREYFYICSSKQGSIRFWKFINMYVLKRG